MDSLFPGLRAMPNIHPVFVHFPLVLLPLALVLQLWATLRPRKEVQRIALGVLYLGTVAAFAAATTGLQAEETIEHPDAAHEVLELHQKLMLAATWVSAVLSVVALVMRRWFAAFAGRCLQVLLLLGLLVVGGLLAVGADRGGQLVYQFGVGVQPAPPAGGSPPAPPGGDEAAPAPARAPEKKPEHKHNHQHQH